MCPRLGIFKRKKGSEQKSNHARVHEKKNLGQEKKKSVTKKHTRPRIKELGQEKKKKLVKKTRTRPGKIELAQENAHSTKKAST